KSSNPPSLLIAAATTSQLHRHDAQKKPTVRS
ncbi:hypothetical protein H9Q71_014465, partial [Fusarium xylarioides]